jgi:hypothetical protein
MHQRGDPVYLPADFINIGVRRKLDSHVQLCGFSVCEEQMRSRGSNEHVMGHT